MSVGVDTPNELMVVFSNTISAGFDALQGSVNGVFSLMIALVVALTGIQWALSPNREVLASGFGKVLLIGAFAWLINDWQSLSETLWSGFVELGLTAGGGALSRADFLNPGAILAQGWGIVRALGDTPAPVDNPLDVVGNMADALILGLAMIGIMLAFAVLALQIIVTLLEFKIVTLGGFILLPFGIWTKSAFLAERPLGYVISSGLKVLALAIVVSGARTVFDQLQPSDNPDIYEALSILVAAILLAMLALFIPNLASALVTGGPALGAGAALAGTLAVGGAGALAGAGLAGAGAAAGSTAARLIGPAKAAAGAGGGSQPATPSSPGPSTGPASPGSRRGGPDPGPSGGGPTAARARPSNDNPAPLPSPDGALGEPGSHQVEKDGARNGAAGPQYGSRGGTDRARVSHAQSGGATQAVGEGKRDGSWADPAHHAPADAVALSSDGSPKPQGRAAALQAFFVANAGRGLLPAGETSGVLSPNLRNEES